MCFATSSVKYSSPELAIWIVYVFMLPLLLFEFSYFWCFMRTLNLRRFGTHITQIIFPPSIRKHILGQFPASSVSKSLVCIFKDFKKIFLENFLKNYFSIEIYEWIYKYCTHLIIYIIMIWRTRKTKVYSYFILFLGLKQHEKLGKLHFLKSDG
jgi:hypothetical protein